MGSISHQGDKDVREKDSQKETTAKRQKMKVSVWRTAGDKEGRGMEKTEDWNSNI